MCREQKITHVNCQISNVNPKVPRVRNIPMQATNKKNDVDLSVHKLPNYRMPNSMYVGMREGLIK